MVISCLLEECVRFVKKTIRNRKFSLEENSKPSTGKMQTDCLVVPVLQTHQYSTMEAAPLLPLKKMVPYIYIYIYLYA